MTPRASTVVDLKTLLIHEAGHRLHDVLTGSEENWKGQKYFGVETIGKYKVKDKKTLWYSSDEPGVRLARYVSSYALANPMELFAEFFAAYHKGYELPKEMYDLIERALEAVKHE